MPGASDGSWRMPVPQCVQQGMAAVRLAVHRGGVTTAAALALALAAALIFGAVSPAWAQVSAPTPSDAAASPASPATPACRKPVYLTFDTGHMGVAPLIAEVLQRHAVPVTFFVARERTRTEGHTLDAAWIPWWKARVAEGHLVASHTWDHWVLQPGQEAQGREGPWRFKATQGPRQGTVLREDALAYCEQLREPARQFEATVGAPMAALFRAPGGRTTPGLLQAARSCGFQHVGWAPAGFLGDELDSATHPNAALLAKALRTIRAGDVLMAHLGIWSRKDPWAPAVLEPLIVGLKERGFCFRTLRDHPDHAAAARRPAPTGRLAPAAKGPA